MADARIVLPINSDLYKWLLHKKEHKKSDVWYDSGELISISSVLGYSIPIKRKSKGMVVRSEGEPLQSNFTLPTSNNGTVRKCWIEESIDKVRELLIWDDSSAQYLQANVLLFKPFEDSLTDYKLTRTESKHRDGDDQKGRQTWK